MAIPEPILDAARRRAAARAERDWATADRLRGEIETAGWRVVDRGTDFRLEPAHPPDEVSDGVVRHGRSASVPSRLDEPATGPATVVVVAGRAEVAGDGLVEVERSLAGALRHAPAGVTAVVVADGLGPAAESSLDELAGRLGREADVEVELVRTSAELGRGAALNAGIRRARGEAVILLDPSVVPEGDVVSPLVAALRDGGTAVAGPFGLATTDMRHFNEVIATDAELDAAAIQGYLMAFRRADAAARGPLDEAFRFYRNLDVWWSLVLRDAGEGAPPRRAAVVPGLALERHEPRAWTAKPEADRLRRSKRNFYRVLDRYRGRLDLAVPSPGG